MKSQEKYIERLLGRQNSKVHSFWDETGTKPNGKFTEMTLVEVAAKFEVTKERIRQIELTALRKLRSKCLKFKSEHGVSLLEAFNLSD